MAWLAAATALYLALASALFGARRSTYSHLRDTLSELGEHGSAAERTVSWGIFLPIALATFAVAWSAWPRTPAASALGCSLAFGYLGAALFPCDPGAPLRGSRRQALHSLAGALEYGGGISALLALAAQRAQMLYLAAAVLVVLAVAALTLPPLARVRGLLQRIGELALFAALVGALSD